MAADVPVPAGERVLVLLRAVNVGGTGTLPMADLRAAATALGHTDVATHLATGNLLLTPAAGSPGTVDALAGALTADLGDRLGRPLALTVRTRAQLDDVVAGNPYPDEAAADPAHLVVVFWDGDVPPGPLELGRYGRERGTVRGREGYVHYPDGIGRSKVTAAVLDRLAGRTGTGRSWRTVQALHTRLAP
ncbi:DUF1697 domain-containing protein [Cellulomonas sp. NPDC058312]|uniref:DUF1697 domain-containing protein n=1 Tax=Cellulomonas sp. NPDC058312 TaxID=3346441 RepID=UPI0036E15111